MLLVVQLVWIDLIQRSDFFCYLCICVLTGLGRKVCVKGVEMEGLCVACRGEVMWRCWLG